MFDVDLMFTSVMVICLNIFDAILIFTIASVIKNRLLRLLSVLRRWFCCC